MIFPRSIICASGFPIYIETSKLVSCPASRRWARAGPLPVGPTHSFGYGGKCIRRRKSWNRRSERSGSYLGSVFERMEAVCLFLVSLFEPGNSVRWSICKPEGTTSGPTKYLQCFFSRQEEADPLN
jgi:hypothetical protein